MSVPVLFIRSRAIDADDREWLEPVQICCAFDCPTTLLLLGDAAASAAAAAPRLEELHDLGIVAVLAAGAPDTALVAGIEPTAVRDVIDRHMRILHL
jgi:hypothetical protein